VQAGKGARRRRDCRGNVVEEEELLGSDEICCRPVTRDHDELSSKKGGMDVVCFSRDQSSYQKALKPPTSTRSAES
jgi:hypothetical protein